MKHTHRFIDLLKALILMGLLVILSFTISAEPVVIGFEDLPVGGPELPATVIVTSQYADRGVLFNGPIAVNSY